MTINALFYNLATKNVEDFTGLFLVLRVVYAWTLVALMRCSRPEAGQFFPRRAPVLFTGAAPTSPS